MPNRGFSYSRAKGLLWTGILWVALLLTGCPPGKDMPKPYLGSDFQRIDTFTYSAMKVAVMPSARRFSQVDILLRRGGDAFRGFEGLALESVIYGGSSQQNATSFGAALEAEGAILDIVEAESYAAIRLRCMPDHLTKAFKLVSSAIVSPKLAAKDVEHRIAVWRNQLRQINVGPQAEADEAARTQFIQNSITAFPWQPNANSITGVTVSEFCEAIRNDMLVRNRIAIVASGAVSSEQIGDLLFDNLDQLPEGVAIENKGDLTLGGVWLQHKAEKVEAATAFFPAPKPSEADAFPFWVASQHLQSKLRKRLVYDLKLALGVEASYVGEAPCHLRIDLWGPRMVQSAELALSEVRMLKERVLTPQVMDSLKASLRVDLDSQLETNQSWSRLASEALLLNGWGSFGNPGERLEATTPAHIQYVGQKFLHGVSWVIVGDTTSVDRKTLQRL